MKLALSTFLAFSNVLLLGIECFECPHNETTGHFMDTQFCDNYWHCDRGVASQQQCSDGLVFDPDLVTSTDAVLRGEPCDFIFRVDCSGRDQLSPARGTGPCVRQNGYFSHQDIDVCDQYYVCTNNEPLLLTCAPGLHFNLEKRICDWPEGAARGACGARQAIGEFTCDPSQQFFTENGQRIAHPTFADEEDCARFYVCKNGVVPERQSCTTGLVYSLESSNCLAPEQVPECADYYKDEEPVTSR